MRNFAMRLIGQWSGGLGGILRMWGVWLMEVCHWKRRTIRKCFEADEGFQERHRARVGRLVRLHHRQRFHYTSDKLYDRLVEHELVLEREILSPHRFRRQF